MTIEFTNATPAKSQSPALSVTLLVVSCLFFFVPATLIVLGYYSSLPTGSLISPLPQGVLSNSPTPIQAEVERPVIAAPENSTQPSSATASSNAVQKSFTLLAKETEYLVTDPQITEQSQIYIINKEGDKSLYSIKNKSVGQFVLSATTPSDTDRTIDYQIVNP